MLGSTWHLTPLFLGTEVTPGKYMIDPARFFFLVFKQKGARMTTREVKRQAIAVSISLPGGEKETVMSFLIFS